MRIGFVASALVGLLASASAGSVDSLTAADFDERVIDSGKSVLVKHFAPWCGHCKAMAPAYEQLAEKYQGTNVDIVEVDCTKEQDLCGRFGVTGYPTLRYFSPETGPEGAAYSGSRNFEGMDKFVVSDLLVKCSPSDRDGCSEKELVYLIKYEAKSSEERAAQLARLEGMRSGKMNAELKKWLSQRINILKQLE